MVVLSSAFLGSSRIGRRQRSRKRTGLIMSPCRPGRYARYSFWILPASAPFSGRSLGHDMDPQHSFGLLSTIMFTPVLFRELAGMSRRRSQYVLRAAVVGTILAVVGAAWSTEMTAAMNNGIMDYRALADRFFQLFCAAQLIVIVLITAAVVAG